MDENTVYIFKKFKHRATKQQNQNSALESSCWSLGTNLEGVDHDEMDDFRF